MNRVETVDPGPMGSGITEALARNGCHLGFAEAEQTATDAGRRRVHASVAIRVEAV
jgi:hypothetical protein